MAAAVAGTGVLVPLYIFPGQSPQCTAWASLLNVISANPSVPFIIIINPNSGPGAVGSQPDSSSYQGCVPQLKSQPNVRTIGYVFTEYGSRSQSDVDADVSTYAGWDSAYRLDGIFFDQVETTSDLLSTYTAFVNTARQSFDDSNGFVILNPGTNVQDDGFFSIADQIVTAEDFYSDFSPSQLSLGSSTPTAKQAVILHDAPSSPPISLIDQLVTDGIGSLYITDDTQANGGNPYDSLPSDLSSFVATVGADS
ncbi:uncharacterized protein PHACADRAFT_191536 [Phanerochaete carnosa HHB-10118-sp]|uniref:Spherulin 4-like cell surface protein n=1 Tax=Phanerochaete carnosa (strain HHB-10118-sp) TaxID=650164 RepID=K5WIK3_PHACS|nr:uncharacterized protein PHACADRAFT_191536 [Phanerochaete carnosa HHB-10118-sp]EKM59215.1 hypothetical protein PHACADRAFT_191536 [Phanerochaete carnosa HHB-10118-sp]